MRRLPFEYAVRNLGRSPTRLGILVVGCALLVLVVLTAAGFVRGMNEGLRISGSPDNVILLGAGSESSIERSEVEMGVAGQAMASIPGIVERSGASYVSPEIHVMLAVQTRMPDNADNNNDDPGAPATIRGVTPEALLVHEEITIVEGRFPESGRDEVMIGSTAAARLGARSRDLAVGATILIDGRPWTIVGRFNSGGTLADSEIWAPLTDLMEATKRDSISCVVITLDPAQAEYEDIAVFTMIRPDLELVAMRETEYYADLAAFFAPIRIVVWVTALLIAIGGFMGGLNTMYAAFVSRVREFGALQAIGFKRRAILLSLVQESTIATAAGTLIACAVGVWVLDGVAVRSSMGAFGLRIDATALLIALAVGFGLGALGALPPAVRCLRMPIPDALKSF